MPGPLDRYLTRPIMSHVAVMVAVSAVLGLLVAGLALPFAGLAGYGADRVAETVEELPEPLQEEALPQRTEMLDVNGDVFATVYDENRVNVSLSNVSRTMTEAIVSIEDYRFYQHGALDLKGTLRAFVSNMANNGVVQGGSSITQQMVKLTLAQQADSEEERKEVLEDTYARKLNELRYAIAVEEKRSKDWILERYLNIAYFGDGAYGIQSAARHYFNVNAKDLNLRQSAMLAGIVKNPTAYDPTNSPDRARLRRNVVLDRMAQLDVISTKRADKVKDKKLGLKVRNTNNGCVNSSAAFFCDYVLSYLLRDKSLGKTREDRRNLIYGGGLQIQTTLDLRMQKASDKSVRSTVFPTDRALGALAFVEPGTGEVRTLSQSRPMGNNKRKGETYLNFTVPEELGGARGSGPGSTFKVFTLAAALEQGVPPRTRIDATKSPRFFDFEQFRMCDGEPYGYGTTYEVNNSTGNGVFDLYKGTQQSVNTVFVQLETITGLCKPFRMAKKMGINLTNPTGDSKGRGAEMTPSFTLGAIDVSPLEMAEAYATFPARGIHCESRPVNKLLDAAGTEVKTYEPDCERVMKQVTADTVNDILRGVMENGFGSGLQLSQVSAGKTGTNQNSAVSFGAYTPNLAGFALIAGLNKADNPDNLSGKIIGGSYRSVSGSGFAGPVWANAMREIDDFLPDKDFVSPGQISTESSVIPSTSGMSVSEARKAITKAGFNPAVGSAVASAVYQGGTAYTAPSSGSTEAKGSVVTIYPSTGVAPPPEKKKKKKKKKQDRGRDDDRGNGGESSDDD